MTRALVVRVEGTAEFMDITADLAGIQPLIGGWLEGISPNAGNRFGLDWHAYVNEEGKLEGLPVNRLGTMLAKLMGWRADDVLCGTVVFLGDHPEGDESDVPAYVEEALAVFTQGPS